MHLSEAPSWVLAMGWIAGAILSGTVIWTKGLRPLWRASRGFIRHLTRAWSILEHLESEIKPNGGSSIKDQLNVTTTGISSAASLMEYVSGSVHAVENRMDRLERLLHELMAYVARDPSERTRFDDPKE